MNKVDEKRLSDLYDLMDSPKKSDRRLIEQAYFFSKKAHRGQKRLSDKPYFLHTYATAHNLAELGLGPTAIAAGFLHDTIEDGAATEEAILSIFGDEVLFLVQGVTKLGRLQYHGMKRHTESLRKLFVAMSHDIRVLIIKLADRLHNMKTLNHVPKDKQHRIALETLEIYAPLAHRLGIGKLKGQLEDLAFPYVYPEEYKQVRAILKQESKKNIKRLNKIDRTLKRKLGEIGIRKIKTDYRVKHLYSLWKKLEKYDMNIERVFDIAALRVLMPSEEDCYTALGIIHKQWKPLPGRIKDYIANPKPNGYQSLHTTVFTGDGGIVEIQIRTPEMHHEAEFGVASHVGYKDGKNTGSTTWALQILSPITRPNENEGKIKEETPPWLRQLAKLQKNVNDPREFLQNLKTDFFDERVFVFTPKGEVIDLPAGATPIDFAYAVHSDIGDHMAGAKVNGKMISIDTELRNGDIVEIDTKRSSKPSQKWLTYAKTTLARRRIRAQLRLD